MYFNITIQNLFNLKNKYKKYTSFYKPISKNKNIEIETYYSDCQLFKFEIDLHIIGRDHAGFNFEINMFGWQIDFRIYDSRHWDYKNWCWEEKY